MVPMVYVVTRDPYRTWQIARLVRNNWWVHSLLPQDPLPTGPVLALIIDLDSVELDPFGRARLLEQAKDSVLRFPVIVMSSNLDGEEIALLSKGFITATGLDAMMMPQLTGPLPAGANVA